MAKKSKIAKNEQRKRTVARYADRRAALKAVLRDPDAGHEARQAAAQALQRLPRDASPTRVRSRSAIGGRPRGVLTRFELDRITFRQKALDGELPGIRKASW
ncbi:30S ribosomal protein S14 [Egicoccus sp. AB-alg2]|uniref:30S ribosomal protein S14 n=1 Tax=Egicoccus sp. AB-alg2 TaxID=3242693 RepID=UPI00359D1375